MDYATFIKMLIRLSRYGLLEPGEHDSYSTEFANQFCHQLAINEHGLRNMKSFYLFHDKRPGTVLERFEIDARKFWEYQKMFQL